MPDEYHGWRRPSHQLLQQLYLMTWFYKYSNKNKGVPADTNNSQKLCRIEETAVYISTVAYEKLRRVRSSKTRQINLDFS